MSSDAPVATLESICSANGVSLQSFLDEIGLLTKEQSEIHAGLASIGNQMPGTQRGIYTQRLKDIERQLRERAMVAGVLAAGYSPYIVPEDFSVGFVDRPSDAKILRLGKDRGVKVFNAPIPVEQMKKYFAAVPMFHEIVIASAEHGLFRDVRAKDPPRPTYVDPFMVGLVAIPEFWGPEFKVGSLGSDIKGAQAFLISHWDLSRELAAAR